MGVGDSIFSCSQWKLKQFRENPRTSNCFNPLSIVWFPPFVLRFWGPENELIYSENSISLDINVDWIKKELKHTWKKNGGTSKICQLIYSPRSLYRTLSRERVAIRWKIVSVPIGNTPNFRRQVFYFRYRLNRNLSLFLYLPPSNNLRTDLNYFVAFCFTLVIQVKFIHFLLQQKSFLGIFVHFFFLKVNNIWRNPLVPTNIKIYDIKMNLL